MQLQDDPVEVSETDFNISDTQSLMTSSRETKYVIESCSRG